jgi:hypothetical protein
VCGGGEGSGNCHANENAEAIVEIRRLSNHLHFAIPTAINNKIDAKAEAAILPKRPAHAKDTLIAAQQAAESAWKENYYQAKGQTFHLVKQLANANTQIIGAKQTAETAMNKQNEAKTEMAHLSKQLVTTHH